MERTQRIALAGVLTGVVLAIGFATGQGQVAAPTQSKGVSVGRTVTVDLGPEIEGMAGYQLRMRLITLAPEGVLAVHSHKGRPTTEYMLQGSVLDHRGNHAKEVGAGALFAETKDTVHWVENTGTVPAVVISADIVKRP